MRRWAEVAVAPLPLAAVAVTLAVAAPAEGGRPEPGEQRPAFRIRHPAVDESSGLVVSRTRPRLAYTVDDSGNAAKAYAVDMRTGRLAGVTTLAGVEAVDVEALASAPGGRLLVADIGDNRAVRDQVSLHLVAEPAPGDREVRPRSMRLRYAGGPRDAEAVLVRAGRVHVISKHPLRGRTYRGPRLSAWPRRGLLRPVAAAPALVTDATVLADGRVVLRTYADALVMGPGWTVRRRVPLPLAGQGETLAAAPRSAVVYAGSEGERSPVHRVAVPADPPPASGPARTPTPTVPTSRPPSPPAGTGPGDEARWAAGGAVVLLLIAAAAATAVRMARRG